MSAREFAGRTVLITGGGGGIGYATAELLAERGAAVVALGPDDRGLAEVAALPRAVGVPGDAADENDVRRAVDAALRNGGRLDAVVCCAGIGTFGTVLDPEPGWQDTLHANLDTAYVTTRHALPALIDTGGSVVLVSSLAGTLAVPGAAAYTTSKHALVGLTRSLAADFGPHGVRANVVCPGAVRTRMLDRVMDEIGSRSGLDRDTAYARAGSLVPLRRAAEPSEIAEVIAFLAGPRSAVVTGAVLMADGGASAVDLSLSALDAG
ncbi:SDR family oxidoreductase [Streptomyces phaeolivaceus]|uniref:SDR family oxidoreductase n=1 Tax=Streptomyces phaeolivaceus TaxID=2653200 RepID=A0A5P8JVA2_9ACTN|nr:SDR family oxidoreductase [Streptomyces phaeolivaceus]QFQ94945.1 SDR family oxidoreductase [Streptomyces phaeolivaceus]